MRPDAGCADRRADGVYAELRRQLPTGRGLCRQDPQLGQTRRPSSQAADQVRAGHQYQDRQSTRPDDPTGAAGSGRPGGRVVDRRGLRPASVAGFMVALVVVAGCGGVSPSSGWQANCPRGSYAAQSLEEWFRTSSEVAQGRRGPQVEGYIYNNYFAGAEQMLVAIERLSPSGQAVDCSMVWVGGIVQPRDRAYFIAPVPDASATYRVRILSFNWANKGGP
jgi:hypothetical protein